MTLCITYNPLPGKTAECDDWVRDKLVPFFRSQKECTGVRVLEDILIGDPERTCLVELGDVCSATSILESVQARELKREFMNYACDFSSQMLRSQPERPESRGQIVSGHYWKGEDVGEPELDVYIGT